MQASGISELIEVVKVGWRLIVTPRFVIKLLVLIGLCGWLGYLVWRRRSKTLSVLVERKFAEYKGKLRRRLSLSERLSSLKYVITALLLPIFISGVVGSLGLMFGKGENNPQDVGRFLGTLHACGTIVASFTVLLITIIVFTVTINSAYVVKASSLFKFYLQRLYFKPVLAFAAGTVIACLMNSIIINHFYSWPLVTVTIIVFLGCSVISLDLVVLFTAVRVLVRSAISEFLAESYVTEHRNSLLANVKRMLAQTMNAEVLESLGFLWNPYGFYDKSERAEYTIKGRGLFVNDVHFARLEKLAKNWNLRPIERKERQRLKMNGVDPPNVRVWPGQKLPEKEDRYAAMFVKDAECEFKAQRTFDKAFVCRKKERWSVAPVEWSEISHLLKTLVEDKDTAGVKNVLEAFRSIASDYLESRREIGWPHAIHTLDEDVMSPYRAPTLMNLDLFNFIRFAIRNEDEECLDEISRFLYGMAYTAFEFESEQYFEEVLVRLNWLYELSRGSERLAERAAANVVRYYKYVGNIFDGHVYKDEDNTDLYNHVFPFVQKYLANILNGMKQAAKFGDKETFQKLLENANSLLKHHIPDDIFEQYLYNYEQKDPALLEAKLKIRDIMLLSNLVISAWLYRGVKESEYDQDTIKPFIETALERVLDFNTLIETYLLAESLERYESGLGYDWWELSEKEPGESIEGSNFGNWIQPFWITIALRQAASKPKINLKKIRLLHRVREFDCQALLSQIDSILNSGDHKWLTGKENLRKGKEYLLGVFGALAQRQRKVDYEKIITDRIEERAIDAFKKRMVEAYESELKLRNMLTEYQCSEQENAGTSTKALGEFRWYIDKEDLTGDGRDTGLARICGEHVGQRESLYYAWIMEKRLVEKGTIGNFGELAARIKNEATRLRKKGFNPQVVLIPWDHRYEQALTDVPKWKRKCPLAVEVLPRWVTTLDGMEVFVWPHKRSECVGIIDIGAFARFKEKEDIEEVRLSISFRRLTGDDLSQFLVSEVKNRDRREFRRWLRTFEYDMDKVAEMQRILVIEDMVRLELLVRDAGVKLLPVEKTMGIVYGEGQTVYHLPECKLAQEIPVTERRYFTTLGLAKLEKGFQRCDSCHPDRERQ